ncbi:MAG: hypothetical protein FJ125_11010, partial [Deltaproteobacteria bacterium]|nr:hypothetical protein [Deltaproteobacteria bacterium]
MKTHRKHVGIVAVLPVLLALAAAALAGCGGGGEGEREDRGPAPADGGGREDQGVLPDGSSPDADAGPGCTQDEQCPGQTPEPGPCQAAACRQGACTVAPAREGEACDDGDACTGASMCRDGVCLGSDLVTCPAPPSVC